MDKHQFWNIIDSVNESSVGKDRETHRVRVIGEIAQCSLEEIMDWHLILTEYSNAANRYDLWAASVALGAHYSDDSFIDFRSWLISRGNEVYMNAMRDPDSLAGVPLENEKINFEEFGSVAYHAYEAKLFRVDPHRMDDLFRALNTHTLDPNIKAEIHADLPERQDISEDWPMWMLPEWFPNICKTRTPKDIGGLLKSENMVYGYVHKNSRRTQYIFQYTPENIASFLGSRPDASAIIVTDVADQLILRTVGNFIDECPDKALLEKIKKYLIPIQTGEAEARPFFCPTRDEVVDYCNRRHIWA